MFYIIGDIHSEYHKLDALLEQILPRVKPDDIFIFLGDYIDRGEDAYETVSILYRLSRRYECIFLTGNHENMLYGFLTDTIDKEVYFFNGGLKTINSYRQQYGKFMIPEHHMDILFRGIYYYEGEDFIAVHAGINPEYKNNLEKCPVHDLLWIRDKFFHSDIVWDKTVIFGHTPTHYLNKNFGVPYFNKEKNIIGIDTGAVYGGKLTCLCWPSGELFQS